MNSRPGGKIIVNLVDEVSQVNFGIWHAAIASAKGLKEREKIQTILAAPTPTSPFPEGQYPDVEWIALDDLSQKAGEKFLARFDPQNTIIATHGCWQYATRWGAISVKTGFRWVYCPHGMLEPWSMQHKWFKKKIYFELFEKPMANKAQLVRAVGGPEEVNLKKRFSRVKRIANGIYDSDFFPLERPDEKRMVLFLARLHHKKGVLQLVESWKQSRLWQSADFELCIAGTDDGEEKKLTDFIAENPGNIRFMGPVFGTEKQQLLMQAHFYILPSLSEGFPTSVLEAMAAGLTCIITPGCNFPEAIKSGMAIETATSKENLIATLNQLPDIEEKARLSKAAEAQNWVQENYLWSAIGSQQADTYFQLPFHI